MKSIRAIYRREMLKFIRNRAEMFSYAFMGIIFLFIFMWAGGSTTDGTGLNYQEYMVAGVIIMTGFMGGFSGALTIINDKSTGFMKEFLIAPIRREFIVIAKLLSVVTQSAITMLAILVVAVLIPEVNFQIFDYVQLMLIGLAASLISASIGMVFSTMISSASGFMAMQSVVLMPMMFMSGAYIPLGSLPSGVRAVAMFNPLTYLVALIRGVGSNGSLPNEIKDALFINLDFFGFKLENWMMWTAVWILGAIMVMISLKRFKNINMSTKVDFNEIM